MCSEKQKHNLVLEQDGTKVLSEPEAAKQDNTRRCANEKDDYRYNEGQAQARDAGFRFHEGQEVRTQRI